MILYASPIWAHRVIILSNQKALDRITRQAGIAISGVLATASLEAVTQLAHLHPLSDLAMWTLVIHAASSTAPAEDFNRSPSGAAHLTSTDFLRAELMRIQKSQLPLDRNGSAETISILTKTRLGRRRFKQQTWQFYKWQASRQWQNSVTIRKGKEMKKKVAT